MFRQISNRLMNLSLLSQNGIRVQFSSQSRKSTIRQQQLSLNQYIPLTTTTLYPNDGSHRNKKRLGRGIGSGKGKTSGSGHKGQLSRAGGSVGPDFEGGQTPIHKRLRKYGSDRLNKNRPGYLNLVKLVEWIQKGRIDGNKKINIYTMVRSGLMNKDKVRYGVKLLNRGYMDRFNMKLEIEVSDASESVIQLIKQQGGSITCVHRNHLRIKEHIFPERFGFVLEEPVAKKTIVNRMSRVYNRGAEVEFNQPRWLIEMGGVQGLNQLRDQKKKSAEEWFQYPADRQAGSGDHVVRNRKQKLIRTINILPQEKF